MAAINLSDLSYLLWIRPIVVVVMAALALMAARLRARGRIDQLRRSGNLKRPHLGRGAEDAIPCRIEKPIWGRFGIRVKLVTRSSALVSGVCPRWLAFSDAPDAPSIPLKTSFTECPQRTFFWTPSRLLAHTDNEETVVLGFQFRMQL